MTVEEDIVWDSRNSTKACADLHIFEKIRARCIVGVFVGFFGEVETTSTALMLT